MSKKRLSVLISLCTVMLMTVAVLCGTGIFTASAEDGTVESYRIDIAGAAVRDGQNYLVAYAGEELDKDFAASRLTATPIMSDGSEGAAFDVTADMIDTTGYDNTQAGATSITVTHEGVSATVPVYVYEITLVDPVAPNRVLPQGNRINVYLYDVVEDNQGEAALSNVIDFRFAPEYGISNTMATLVEPGWVSSPVTHELYTVGEASKSQCLIYFGGVDNIPVGTVLTLTDDFRFYRNLDSTWVAVYQFNEEAQYVWDGSAWQTFVAEANDLTVESEITLSIGGNYTPEVTVLPAGAYAPVSMTTEDTDVISVENGRITALAAGTATVTVGFGSVTKTIAVTVEDDTLTVEDYEFAIAGAAVRDGQNYLVAYVGEELDKEFAASRLTATPIMSDGSRGEAFAVTADMIDATDFDNTTAGATTLTFTYEGVTAEIPVWLYQITLVDPVAPNRVLPNGSSLNIYFYDVVEDNQGEVGGGPLLDFRGHPEYGIDNTMATLVEPSWVESPATHEFYAITEWTKIQYFIHFGAGDNIPVGTVLTLTDHFRFYKNIDSTWVAVYQFNEQAQYVWDGSAWQTFVAEANDLSVESEITLSIGGNYTPEVTVLPAGAYAPVSMTTEDTDVISVENGRITALAAGTATVTVGFGSVTKTIAVTVEDDTLTVEDYEFAIAGAAVRDGQNYLVAYVGEELDKEFAASRLTATPIMSDGSRGEAFAVTADMIDVSDYSNQGGESSITVTYEGVSATVPVYVYTITLVDPVNPDRLIPNGNNINVYFYDVVEDNQGQTIIGTTLDFRFAPEYGISNTMATLVEPSWVENPATHEFYSIGVWTKIQYFIYFGGVDNIPVGTVLTLTDQFRFYQNIDSSWVAVYQFNEEAQYVWDGSAWQTFVAEATDFTVDVEEVTLPLNAAYTPEVTILPAGAYGSVSVSTEDTDIVSVENGRIVANAAGTATVTLSLGTITKTITVTVQDSQPQGLILANDRTFYVAENGTFDVSKVRVVVDYGDGFYSDEITLSPDTATFTLDTSVPGRVSLDIACTVNDRGITVEDTVTVSISVQETIETYPDNLICNDDGAWSGTMIMIYFQNTFPNTANVYPQWLTPEQAATMTDYVSYIREGVTVEITSLAYLQNMLTFIPRIDGAAIETYQTGDTILLKKGLCFYRWFGDEDTNHAPIGEGDFVKVGELMYDVNIIYNAQGKFAWHILPVDGIALEETVTVALGGQHAANTQIVPAYATQGEWFYTVEDETIASVSTSGMIRGLAQGQTTVTAVLRDLDGAEIATVTFTVVVEDSVSGLIITSDEPVRVDVGTDLNLESWIEEFGIRAYAQYASGAQGEELIDISGARVTGYDPETRGEQTLTFRVTVDGRSVTGTLVVTVGSGRNSCNSSLTGGGILASVLALAGAALCLKKRQRG